MIGFVLGRYVVSETIMIVMMIMIMSILLREEMMSELVNEVLLLHYLLMPGSY